MTHKSARATSSFPYSGVGRLTRAGDGYRPASRLITGKTCRGNARRLKLDKSQPRVATSSIASVRGEAWPVTGSRWAKTC